MSHRLSTLAALAVLGLTALVVAPSAQASPDRVVGVSLPTQHYSASAVTEYERSTGQDVDVVQTFISWRYAGQPSWSAFPTARAKDLNAVGTTLEISWAPSDPARGATDPEFSLASIAAGTHDAYVRQFATAVKASGAPVRIRFGHEMNGAWVPWNESRSGNASGDFVRAWRHVHDVFAQVGATNATWVWSPNILHAGGTPLAGLYPGDAYVDEVGIDGYSYPLSGCPGPGQLFGPTVAAVGALTAKPVRITEVGVATACAARPNWMHWFFAYLDATPQITGYTWWERTATSGDYRVVPTRDLTAFRQAAA